MFFYHYNNEYENVNTKINNHKQTGHILVAFSCNFV